MEVRSLVVRDPGGAELIVPAFVAGAGSRAGRATLEFFAARIVNRYTRSTYVQAVWRFCAWCDAHAITLRELAPTSVATYLELLGDSLAVASVKVHAAAIRHWLDYLVERGVLPSNPSLSVRTQRLVVTEGKTPVLERDQARHFFATLDAIAASGPRRLLALRDRALFAIMLFGFVRVGAAVRMQVRHFEDDGHHAWLVLREKRGRDRRIPCHHIARAYLQQYIHAAELDRSSPEPLFRSTHHPGRAAEPELVAKPLTPSAVWEILKRRCSDAGLPANISPHSFRATGITIHQQNGGRLEDAQDLAGHADARTTRLYVRKQRAIAQREVERVQI